MKTTSIVATLCLTALCSPAATISHRYSFSGNANDSVGGNHGILTNGATVTATELSLTGTGSGAGVQNMSFTSEVAIGSSYGDTGITVESWYTDTGTGNWGKLFTFGQANMGQEFAYTNARADSGNAAPDRNGAFTFGFRPSLNEEHHLVFTVAQDGNMNAWLDNTQVLTDITTNPLSNVTSQVESIGATAWNDPGHKGTVNEFRIYAGELTGSEVSRNFGLGPNTLIPEPTGAILLGVGTLLGLSRRRRA